MRCFSTSMNCLGVFCVLLAYVLIIAIAAGYFIYILPVHVALQKALARETKTSHVGVDATPLASLLLDFSEVTESSLYRIHLIIAIWLLLNILGNFTMAVFVSPGYIVPTSTHSVDLNASSSEDDAPHDENERWPVCAKCGAQKPPRTHHCSICHKCVAKMDHHCPWLNNCVGHGNHRYFLLFLLYLPLGCFYFLSVSLSQFTSLIGYPDLFDYGYRLALSFGSVLAFAMGIAVGGFGMWHFYLVSISCTTIEQHGTAWQRSSAIHTGQYYVNDYDLGWKRNLRVFFSIRRSRDWLKLLLPLYVKPFGRFSGPTARVFLEAVRQSSGLNLLSGSELSNRTEEALLRLESSLV